MRKKYLILKCVDCEKWHIWKHITLKIKGLEEIATGSYAKIATFDSFWDHIIYMINLTENDIIYISSEELADDNVFSVVMEYNEIY